jgi:hypothetical protein
VTDAPTTRIEVHEATVRVVASIRPLVRALADGSTFTLPEAAEQAVVLLTQVEGHLERAS